MTVDELARVAAADLVRTSTQELDGRLMLARMRRTGARRTARRTAVAVGAVVVLLVVGAVVWQSHPTAGRVVPAGPVVTRSPDITRCRSRGPSTRRSTGTRSRSRTGGS